ncbi:DUF6314 family protein [uncultured Thioclava sp.]|uniref:DUF6314 family protein n=1 Tax=uncultured Thioclava sp. TaxID=473858 RepID=UPI0025E71BEC|nr:DUF6314 family protein [uncultured Thioclava sp.]
MIKLCDFEGAWVLRRQIRHSDGRVARFQGRAVFTPRTGGLHYRESGDLILPEGTRFHAERCYLWHADGAGIAVSFEDGRAFHHVDPARPEAQHWCDPDTYHVSYGFDHWPQWQTVWRVHGPRKDYVMESHYAGE